MSRLPPPSLLTLAAIPLALPAHAADCDKLLHGSGPLVGAASLGNAATPGDAKEAELRIERNGKRTTVTVTADGPPKLRLVFAYEGMHGVSQIFGDPPRRIDFALSDVKGDIESTAPGTTATYTLTSTIEGSPAGVGAVTQTIGPAETIDMSGCKVDAVHVERAMKGDAAGKPMETQFSGLFAPAIGAYLRVASHTQIDGKTFDSTMTVERLEAE